MRKLLVSNKQGLLFESTQAGAHRRGGAVGELHVDCLEVSDRVDVSGGVCRHAQTRTSAQMDALHDGVVLDCSAAESLRESDSSIVGSAGRLPVVPASGCYAGSLFSEG